MQAVSGKKSVQDEVASIFNKSFGTGRYKTSQLVEFYTQLSSDAFVDNPTYPVLGPKSSWLKKMVRRVNAVAYYGVHRRPVWSPPSLSP